MTLPSNWPKWMRDTWLIAALAVAGTVWMLSVSNAAHGGDDRSRENSGRLDAVERKEAARDAATVEWCKSVTKQLERIEKNQGR